MAKRANFDPEVLAEFEAQYDTSHEDAALQTRGQFIKNFPRGQLRDLALDDYVVGHKTSTFCNFVESKTRAWANIQGATASKFGIYFGRTKSDSTDKYRFTLKFGASKEDAFDAVKAALGDLLALGAKSNPDFAAIDANPLSQMFKAKILSLYFPDRFLAVCSAEHLEMLGSMLGHIGDLPYSQYQNLLLESKEQQSATRRWSYPKFMAFLYQTYVRTGKPRAPPIAPSRKKSVRRVDFEEIHKQKSQIGRLAESFALDWEKERLAGAGLEHLIDEIQDLTDRPVHGHDFLSYNADAQPRFIEVKAVAKDREGHRFFLSDNERRTSLSAEYTPAYYFYLVSFDGKGRPCDLVAVRAADLYPNAELIPASYVVRCDLRKLSKNDH